LAVARRSPPRRRTKRPDTIELPVLPVRNTVVFPHLVTPLFVDRERSLRAVEQAMLSAERTILVVAQKEADVERPTGTDVYTVGTEAVIGRVLKMPDGTTSILVQGQRRVQISEVLHDEPYLRVRGVPATEVSPTDNSLEALVRAVVSLYEKCTKLSPSIPDEHHVAAMNIDEPGPLADFVASDLDLSVAQRQELLETLDTAQRLEKVSLLLGKELDVLELQSKIHTAVQEEVDKSQREYLLREQMKAIQKELGEADTLTRDTNQLREKIAASGMPEAVRVKAEEELERLIAIPPGSPEMGVVRTYLDWLVTLPWNNATDDQLDIGEAAAVLERAHYGLDKVKERILEYMAVRKLAGARMRSPILCFVGPPGVGKTSLGRSIAAAMGRRFVRVSLGGIRDEAEIRGHRRTYVGAMPGRVVQTMRTAGTVNPVFMLDEIDKVGVDFRGDPSAALLEVLDPEQNTAFSDHYLDVPYDLSRVLFITTANILDPVPPALRDRLEVIELPGYIEDEKLQIARRFLVPKQLEEHGLTPARLHFSDAALREMIRTFTHEAGVRNLEREIGAVCRKIARAVAAGDRAPRTIAAHSVEKYLGPPRFFAGVAEEQDQIGVATGVSWTPAGGDVMGIEVAVLEGKGNVTLTGQLGEVMRESAQAAMSYARSRAKELGVRDRFWERSDVHLHVPAGAIPKDGPSAGITMASALISALTRRPVRREVAMTGEITLRGRVLPVGGLREKILAAHRAGIKTFVLPRKNLKDLGDVPADVKREVRFVPVDHMDEVLPVALQEAVALRAV
jgi:ATP-dependent Lon protease